MTNGVPGTAPSEAYPRAGRSQSFKVERMIRDKNLGTTIHTGQ